MAADTQTDPHLVFEAASRKAAVAAESIVGRIAVTGSDRIDLLHRLSTNDLLSARNGQVVGTAFTTDKGRMVDYVVVCFLESSLLLLASPGTENRLIEWIEKFHIMEDIRLTAMGDTTVAHTVVGPEAMDLVAHALHMTLTPNMVIESVNEFGRLSVVCVTAFATTMVHLMVEPDRSASLLDRISSVGEGVPRMTEEVFEAFRISRGIPAAGREISEAFNPYECGLTHAISYTKGCYVGQEVIARLDTYQKIQRTMVGVVFEKRLPSVKSNIPLRKEHEAIGVLTSVSQLSIGSKYPALAIVKKESVGNGELVMIESEEQSFKGIVSGLPIEL